MFTRVLIANRGEIACRIIRTCRRLGIHTIAVYSEADATAQHVRQADEAWPIGGPQPADSYLRGDVILDVARKSGAQAIHPGYGFLSENADFADAVEHAGLVFIGPSAKSMRKMGSKAGAKDLMSAHGVPVVPGYTGDDQDANVLAHEAKRIGFPLMIKAAYGGGGKGMRIVHKAAEFASALASCQREAKSAFGRDRVLLERYVETPRHIEFQIFGDRHGNAIHLNERECSAQRRYQKVMEEAPSPFLDPDLRTRMGDAAIAAARALDYVNAGTVEFIVGAQGDFYFMEINTRLQVEHPVTEMTLHLDLVELQLHVASGEPLPGSLMRNKSIPADGHAIELRLYAEDPQAGFLPGSGKLRRLRLPSPDEHVRIDGGVIEGDMVTIFYDPMIAKLIVWDRNRDLALQRMREALAQCEVVGPKSNIDFLERLVRHPAVIQGRIDTGYLDGNLEEFLPEDKPPDALSLFAASTAALLDEENSACDQARVGPDPGSPWAIADAWRIGHNGKRLVCFQHGEQRIEINACGNAGNYALACNEQSGVVGNANITDGTLHIAIDGIVHRYQVRVDKESILLHDGTQRRKFVRVGAFAVTKSAGQQTDRISAPMPGRIVLVKTKVGDNVIEGQELIVMEAMKMELSLRAPRDTTIAELRASAGEFVEADAMLVRFEDAK
ncbi:MAG TPA: biotin carboxylase N-terminal domain-containing protein [Rudaea sp.]|nr:biotin carboxylase N-terminal domain-containing protein [Rudaea sp.]